MKTYKEIYFRTINKKEFFKELKKINNKLKNSSINRYYSYNLKLYGKQEIVSINTRNNFKRKYEYEFSYTNNKDEFINACLKTYPSSNKKSLYKRWWELNNKKKKNIEKNKPILTEEEKVKKFIYENMLDKNEVIKPSKFKLLTLDDMKRLKCKINWLILNQHGFNKAEINWLKAVGKI